MQKLIFRVSDRDLTVILTSNVLNHFLMHSQRGLRREAGGQLFGTFPAPHIMKVVKATGPIPAYSRFWNRISFNLHADQKEINVKFEEGLHYFGDWHTHPDTIPSPSARDYRTFQSRFHHSTHELTEILMVIVGTAPFPEGLWIGLQNYKRSSKLTSL